jgi:hypothetical protein
MAMTAEDWQRVQADMMRRQQQGLPANITMESSVTEAANKPIPLGMMSGYASKESAPEQGGSIEGRQRISDSQRDYANQLRGKGMPKGKTVGPLDVYVGPNWAESLEGAVNQGLGGYLAGKANREDRDIDKARGLEKARLEGIATDKYNKDEGRKDTAEETAAATLLLAQQAETRKAEADIKSARLAQAKQDLAEGKAEPVSWQLNDDPADIINTVVDTMGAAWLLDENNNPTTPFNTEGRTPVDKQQTPAGKVGTAAQQVAGFRSGVFGETLAELDVLMDVEGFDPTTATALWDKLMTSNDFTNFLASEGGQKYASISSTLKEQPLRTATGAAAPNTENKEYYSTLIPGPGDTKGQVAQKRRKLNMLNQQLRKAAGDPEATQEDRDAAVNKILDQMKATDAAETAAVLEGGGFSAADQARLDELEAEEAGR